MSREFFDRLATSLDAMVHLSPGQQAAQDLLDGPARHACLVGGTRSGKTFLIVKAIVKRALMASGTRHAILRFRNNAARQSISLDTLPTVMRRCYPRHRIEEFRQDGYWRLENGSQIWIGGLDDKDRVERILGNEYSTIFLNECSQVPYSSAVVALTRLAQVAPGLTQKAYFDLNPVEVTHWTNRLFGEKRDPITKLPLANPDAYAREFLNPTDNLANLSIEYIESLKALSTRARQRFYEGKYVAELEGALWTSELIEGCRIAKADVPDLTRIVVAIDPATTSGEGSAETGIIVAGRDAQRRGYVLADGSGRYTPTQWAARAIGLFNAFQADAIVAETNQGGAMVEATIRMIAPNVKFKGVHASRGKITRAEPVSALYEAGKIFHVGDGFPELEEQMVSYAAGGTSPDRLDALVWAATELLVDGRGPLIVSDKALARSRMPFGVLRAFVGVKSEI
ncbi:hypothetical protein LMIY3S_01801 [Labrys miyagiensis]